MSRRYTRIETTDPYGKPITVYRTPDGKHSVELHSELTGGYWWVKLKNVNGPGSDGALNVPDEVCKAYVEMFKDIMRRNNKLKDSP